MTASTRVDEFEELRPHLLSVAYRLTGTGKVARFLFGLASRYGPNWLSGNQPALVNGQLGSYTPGAPARDGYPELMPRVTAMTVRDGKVCAVWDIANPDKFTGSPLSDRR